MKRKSSDLNPSSSAAKSPISSTIDTKNNTNDSVRANSNAESQQQRVSYSLSGGNAFTNNGGNPSSFQVQQEQFTQQLIHHLHYQQLQQLHDQSQASQMVTQMANQHSLSYPSLQQLTPLSADKSGAFMYAPVIQGHMSIVSDHQKLSENNSGNANSNNPSRSASASSFSKHHSQSPSSPRTASPLSKSFPNNKLYSSLMDSRKANINNNDIKNPNSEIFTFPQQPSAGIYATSNLIHNTHVLNTPTTPSTSTMSYTGLSPSILRGNVQLNMHI